METPSGTTDHVLSLLQALQQAPQQFGLFAALRMLERARPDLPRLGTSLRLRDDPVRLGQEPSLAFATGTLARVRLQGEAGVPAIDNLAFGMFGPNGALPLTLTEYARDRERNADDAGFVRFVNMLQHRMTTLFYRAWAESDACASLDRQTGDLFTLKVEALAGLAFAPLRDADQVPHHAKLAELGLLNRQSRDADGLVKILRRHFRVPVDIEQFACRWVRIDSAEQTRLGGRGLQAELGGSAILGQAIFDGQSNFRVVLGPLSLKRYADFLPTGSAFPVLADWVKLYCGLEFSCEARLVLEAAEVPAARLGGGACLGWTSWLGGAAVQSPQHRGDLVLPVVH